MKKFFCYRNKIFVISLFVLLTILFYMVPYSHDEWMWGTQEGINLLKNGFQGYNGRYFGDLLSLIITRSVLVKALIMSTTIVILFILINKYLLSHFRKFNKTLACFIVLFLLFSLSPIMIKQTYGWPAAFVNFVPPTLFIILFIDICTKKFKKEIQLSRIKEIICGICISLGMQFFSENITLYSLIVGVASFIIFSISSRKLDLFSLTFSIVSSICTFLMFSNPAYSTAASQTHGYKEITLTFDVLIEKLYSELIPYIFYENKIVSLIVPTLIIIFILKDFSMYSQKYSIKKILNIFVLIISSIYLIFTLLFYPNLTLSVTYNDLIISSFGFLFAFALICFTIINFDSWKRNSLLLIILSIPLVSFSLVAANPIGARSFYPVYIFWILMILFIIGEIFCNSSISTTTIQSYCIATGILVASVLLFYFSIYGYTFKATLQRNNIIEESVLMNAKEINLPKLPNDTYYWQTDTKNTTWLKRFKKFYHIPDNIEVKFYKNEQN